MPLADAPERTSAFSSPTLSVRAGAGAGSATPSSHATSRDLSRVAAAWLGDSPSDDQSSRSGSRASGVSDAGERAAGAGCAATTMAPNIAATRQKADVDKVAGAEKRT